MARPQSWPMPKASNEQEPEDRDISLGDSNRSLGSLHCLCCCKRSVQSKPISTEASDYTTSRYLDHHNGDGYGIVVDVFSQEELDVKT